MAVTAVVSHILAVLVRRDFAAFPWFSGTSVGFFEAYALVCPTFLAWQRAGVRAVVSRLFTIRRSQGAHHGCSAKQEVAFQARHASLT